VVTTIVEQDTKKNIGEMIAERAERGWDLHLAKRQLITKTGEDTYTVPAGSAGRKSYTVHYGGDSGAEDCECTDFGVHRGEVACKHLVAVALIYARRRRVHSRCEVCGAGSSDQALDGRTPKPCIGPARCRVSRRRELRFATALHVLAYLLPRLCACLTPRHRGRVYSGRWTWE
jgi:hypothetical protein